MNFWIQIIDLIKNYNYQIVKKERKKDYTKPELLEINSIKDTESMGCSAGSGASGMCTNGTSAEFGCESGGSAV